MLPVLGPLPRTSEPPQSVLNDAQMINDRCNVLESYQGSIAPLIVL